MVTIRKLRPTALAFVRQPRTLWLALAISSLTGGASPTCAECSTNIPFPGVACYAETRPEPPTRLFVADIDLANPKVRIRVSPGGPDPDGPGRWQTSLMTPTSVGAREGFDLVVNGDFFDARGIKDAEGTNSLYRNSIWAAVNGPAVTDGVVWSSRSNDLPCLVVHKDGRVRIEKLGHPEPDDWQVVAGNTMLVDGGAAVPHQNKVRHPRTAVGLNADATHLILLVVDGRKPGVAVGMSYAELAAELIRLGCHDALNLDGGGSSVMAVRNAATGKLGILNQPSDGRERAVANVLGVTAIGNLGRTGSAGAGGKVSNSGSAPFKGFRD